MINLNQTRRIALSTKTGRPVIEVEALDMHLFLYSESGVDTRHWHASMKASTSKGSRENVFSSQNNSRALMSATAAANNTSAGTAL